MMESTKPIGVDESIKNDNQDIINNSSTTNNETNGNLTTDSMKIGDDSNKSNNNLMETDLPGSVDDEEMKRSIYIGNVDYGTKLTELQELFKSCGNINRITIMNDKRTGMPKGYAYLEFCEPEAVDTALKFDGALFRGRQIKVCTKRKNIPGYNRGRGGGIIGSRGLGRGGFRGLGRGGMIGPGSNIRGYYGNPYKTYRGGYSGNRHIANPY